MLKMLFTCTPSEQKYQEFYNKLHLELSNALWKQLIYLRVKACFKIPNSCNII